MAISTRSTVLGIKEETTAGTPVIPSATGDYIAVQPDFAITPSIETLANDEIRASIGRAKPINGLENPSATISHYLRHSGTEGTAPNYGLLLEASLGAVDDAGGETTVASTGDVSTINVASGSGATFIRGQALLIKDSTNGYAIRPVHSISSDALTLGFDLSAAPATGVSLGDAVTYYPANTGHPSLSLWGYVGNGGALEVMAGGKVTSTSITFEAGQLINASYTVDGTGFYFNPLNVTSTTNKLDFSDGSEQNVSVTAKLYKDPHELASAMQTAMLGASTGITVAYSDTTGKYTFTKSSGTFSLLWNTGANTAETIGSLLGFTVSADDTGTLTYTSDNAIDLSSPQTPTFDDADPLAAKDNVVFIGETDDNTCFGPQTVTINIDTANSDINSVCEESGRESKITTSREITIEVSAALDQYDADIWSRLRQGTETRFMYNFGTKSGGNWVAGKCGCIYVPRAVVDPASFSVVDQDGIAFINFTLIPYVDSSGNGEFYISFV